MQYIYSSLLSKSTPIIFAQVEDSCSEPSMIIVVPLVIALIAASGLFVVTAGVAIVGTTTTLVTMIMSGASIATIAAALGLDVSVVETAGALSALIVAIGSVLGSNC